MSSSANPSLQRLKAEIKKTLISPTSSGSRRGSAARVICWSSITVTDKTGGILLVDEFVPPTDKDGNYTSQRRGRSGPQGTLELFRPRQKASTRSLFPGPSATSERQHFD